MSQPTRYWTDHLWPELLVKSESIGAKQVVLASDYDCLTKLVERLPVVEKVEVVQTKNASYVWAADAHSVSRLIISCTDKPTADALDALLQWRQEQP